MTRTGKRISPGAAIGSLFVPFYNYYWVFAQSAGLCEALDGQLATLGSSRRAPRGLAIAASVVQIIPYANILTAPLLWLPYIFLVDEAKAEYWRAATASAVG